MREKLRKIAFFIGIASILPLFFFALKKEEPPPEVKIKTSNKQSVENFTLEEKAKDRTKWILKAPKAVFKDEKVIILYKPVLLVKGKANIFMKSEKAVYDREERVVNFDNVKLERSDMTITTSSGKYYENENLFDSDDFCKILFKSGYKIEGKGCIFNFQTQKLTIKKDVKTVISGGYIEKGN